MLRPLIVVCALAVVGFSQASFAQEGEGEGGAGEGEGEGEGAGACGAITPQGQCDGNIVSFCGQDANGNPQVVTIDCTNDPTFTGKSALCQEINPDYGFDCAVPQGSTCIVQGAQGAQLLICQGGATASCDISGAGGTCSLNGNGCSAADSGTCTGTVFEATCGALINQTQTNGQDVIQDCAAFAGSTCTDGVGCLNAPLATCVAGTVCGTSAADAVACPASGTCPAAGGEGEGEGAAGEGEGAAGEGEGEGEGQPATCSCTTPSTTGAASGLAAFALLGVVIVRRRR